MMEKLLSDLKGHSSAWPFQEPVNEKEVADYYLHISHPMGKQRPSRFSPFLQVEPELNRGCLADLSTMEHKLDTNQYHDMDAFLDDAQLIFSNCRTYNPEDTVYHKNAVRLERYLREQMKTYGLVRSSKVKRERDE